MVDVSSIRDGGAAISLRADYSKLPGDLNAAKARLVQFFNESKALSAQARMAEKAGNVGAAAEFRARSAAMTAMARSTERGMASAYAAQYGMPGAGMGGMRGEPGGVSLLDARGMLAASLKVGAFVKAGILAMDAMTAGIEMAKGNWEAGFKALERIPFVKPLGEAMVGLATAIAGKSKAILEKEAAEAGRATVKYWEQERTKRLAKEAAAIKYVRERGEEWTTEAAWTGWEKRLGAHKADPQLGAASDWYAKEAKKITDLREAGTLSDTDYNAAVNALNILYRGKKAQWAADVAQEDFQDRMDYAGKIIDYEKKGKDKAQREAWADEDKRDREAAPGIAEVNALKESFKTADERLADYTRRIQDLAMAVPGFTPEEQAKAMAQFQERMMPPGFAAGTFAGQAAWGLAAGGGDMAEVADNTNKTAENTAKSVQAFEGLRGAIVGLMTFR